MKQQINVTTYITTLIVTVAIFTVGIVASTYFSRQRTEQIKNDESKIAIDLLSLETQYDLLKESSCKDFDRASLRRELDDLSYKIEFMEGQLGEKDPEVFRLRRYYSLLEIKYYVLMQSMAKDCHLNNVFVLYFYDKNNCPDCVTQDYLLKAIKSSYPNVEIFSFDYYLDLSAVKTLITLHNIPDAPPVVDINGSVYGGFKTLEDFRYVIEQQIALTTRAMATSTASSTKKINTSR